MIPQVPIAAVVSTAPLAVDSISDQTSGGTTDSPSYGGYSPLEYGPNEMLPGKSPGTYLSRIS